MIRATVLVRARTQSLVADLQALWLLSLMRAQSGRVSKIVYVDGGARVMEMSWQCESVRKTACR